MRGWALVLLVACSDKHEPAPKPQAPASTDPWQASGGSSLSTPMWTREPKVLRDTLTSVNAHVTIMSKAPRFPDYAKVLERVEHGPDVVGAEAFVFAELAISGAGGSRTDVGVKGVDPRRVDKVLRIGEHMVRGRFDLLRERTQSPAILIGDVLADQLGADLGDVITLTVPGEPRSLSLRVAGMFHYELEEYDDSLAIVTFASLQQLIGRGDMATGIDLRLRDVDRAADVATALGKELGDSYQVLDWYQLNKQVFARVFGDWHP